MNRRKFVKETTLEIMAVAMLPNLAFGNNDNVSYNDKAVKKVLDYIKSNWERTIYIDAPGKGFKGFDLPYSYTTPSIKGEGHFTFFFYWDTYFTNLGLLRNGYEEQAKNWANFY